MCPKSNLELDFLIYILPKHFSRPFSEFITLAVNVVDTWAYLAFVKPWKRHLQPFLLSVAYSEQGVVSSESCINWWTSNWGIDGGLDSNHNIWKLYQHQDTSPDRPGLHSKPFSSWFPDFDIWIPWFGLEDWSIYFQYVQLKLDLLVCQNNI